MSNKIVINGSEPDDIKLNGVTPDKIMLNGQCYFEKPEPGPTLLYDWDFTDSLTDKVNGVTAELTNVTFTEGTGIVSDNRNGHVRLTDQINLIGKTIEIDYASLIKDSSDSVSRVFGCGTNDYFGYENSYTRYVSKKSNSRQSYTTTSNTTSFTNKTFKIVFLSDSELKVYVDDEIFYEGGTFISNNNYFYIGNANGTSQGFGNFTVTGVRIYENEE